MRRLPFLLGLTVAALVVLVRLYERYVFPRDPVRTIDPAAKVVAPADGRVVYAVRVEAGSVPIAIKGRSSIPLEEIVKGLDRPRAGTLVGIFMSPFDVHYQRSPITGTVKEVSYHPAPHNHVMGSMFLRNLFRLQPMYSKSPHIHDNERIVIHIEGDGLDAFVVQIADQQVNRIDCYVHEGDRVAAGDKIGMIRRGSQVDLFLAGLEPSRLAAVQVGSRMTAGESVLLV